MKEAKTSLQGISIGRKLHQIRSARGLSLEQTAKLTLVSKPMLSQIERGLSMPTVTTLWNIATGLKVPFSCFLEAADCGIQIVRAGSEPHLWEEKGAMRVWNLFAFDPLRSVEMFRIELDPDCRHSSKAHEEGVEEYIFVESGALILEVDDQNIWLHEKEALRFRADRAHCYSNPEDTICCFTNLIFYPKSF